MNDKHVKLSVDSMGRTIADVFDDGLIIDKILAHDKLDCLATIRLNYPTYVVYDPEGERIFVSPITLTTRNEQSPVSPHAPGDFQRRWIDAAVHNILVETELERAAGTLKPFVEGEPIGVIPANKRRA